MRKDAKGKWLAGGGKLDIRMLGRVKRVLPMSRSPLRMLCSNRNTLYYIKI